jgi:Transposase DDE domain group 1
VGSIDSPRRVVLDMDSTEIPVYGQQEHSSYNGHFETTCYHPLLLFNGEGDGVAAKLRPGNVHRLPRTGQSCYCRRLSDNKNWAKR